MKNYYIILGLNKNCSTHDVKIAYKRLAKLWHPDKNKSQNAQETFIEIHEAYEILSNPIKRRLHDQLIFNDYSYDIKSLPEKYKEYNSFVFQAKSKAHSVSKMNYDLFLEKIFLGVGKAKYIFWGFIGLILVIVSFLIILDGKIGEIVLPMLFGILMLKQAYDGLIK